MLRTLVVPLFCLLSAVSAIAAPAPEASVPTVADGMTITTPVFASQMQYLHDNGYKVRGLLRRHGIHTSCQETPLPRLPLLSVVL
jgi:hypothetical protein